MKIAIIGAGAMGSLFGGKLSYVADVCLYDVNRQHVDAVNEHGLIMSQGEKEYIARPRATSDPEEIGTVDAAIFFTKYTFMEAAVKDAMHCIGPDTFVVSLQNGIGAADVIRRHVDDSQVAYGLTAYTSDMKGPGHIEMTTHDQVGTYFWPVNGVISEKAMALEKVMNEAGFETKITKDVDKKIWRKLMINCSENVLSSILRIPVGRLVETEGSMELIRLIIGEISAVAQAKGIDLTPEEGLDYVLEVSKAVAEHLPSMALDVKNSRKTEIAVLNEAVAAEGKLLGIETPVISATARLIRALEDNYGKFEW